MRRSGNAHPAVSYYLACGLLFSSLKLEGSLWDRYREIAAFILLAIAFTDSDIDFTLSQEWYLTIARDASASISTASEYTPPRHRDSSISRSLTR